MAVNGGAGDDGPPLTELESLQLKANQVTDDSLESTRRMIQLCEDVSSIGYCLASISCGSFPCLMGLGDSLSHFLLKFLHLFPPSFSRKKPESKPWSRWTTREVSVFEFRGL